MANLNLCQFIGNLTRDPELTYIPSGTAVVKTCIAVNETWTKDGVKKTSVQFINLTIWGKGGEIFQKYTQKGSHVYVSGKLKIDKVEKDGTTRYYTNIVVRDFQFLGRKGDGGGGGGGASLPETEGQYGDANSVGADPGFAGLPETDAAAPSGASYEIPSSEGDSPVAQPGGSEALGVSEVDDMDIPF